MVKGKIHTTSDFMKGFEFPLALAYASSVGALNIIRGGKMIYFFNCNLVSARDDCVLHGSTHIYHAGGNLVFKRVVTL